MIIKKTALAGIVNESNTKLERLAAKIVRLPGGDSNPYIKTCPLQMDKGNLSLIKKLKDDLQPSANKGFIGIGITAYANNNYIEFYSAIKSFPLNQGDHIVLHFEDGKEIALEFTAVNKAFGFLKRNNCFIPDGILSYMANSKLAHWKLTNIQQQLVVTGGFECNEHNNQYRSKKTGQRLLQDVIQEIISLKTQLRS